METQFEFHHQQHLQMDANDRLYDASASEADYDHDFQARFDAAMEKSIQQHSNFEFAPLAATYIEHHKRKHHQKRATSEPTQKTLDMQMRKDQSSDEEYPTKKMAAKIERKRQPGKKQCQGKRRASWPALKDPNDSAVQGLETSSESNQQQTPQKGKETATRKGPLSVIGWGREEGPAFKGISDADENEERWREIVLEEHMDRIFGPLLGDERVESERKDVVALQVVGSDVWEDEADEDAWGIPVREKGRFQNKVWSVLGVFGCVGKRKGGAN